MRVMYLLLAPFAVCSGVRSVRTEQGTETSMDDVMITTCLVFYVNGKRVVDPEPDPEMTLLNYLRINLCLTGTKLGCAEGGCGACTVMVSQYDRKNDKLIHYSMNACLAPVCSMHGLAVTTVEGIGNIKKGLHPVQERIAKSHGSQCGFCTPGIVMSMYTLLRNNPQPSVKDMESAFEGNLCRCTGYRPILQGFRTFTKEYQCGMGEYCCKNRPEKKMEDGFKETSPKLYDEDEFIPHDPSQELIFPSELKLTDEYDRQSLVFRSERVTWYRPTSLEQLLDLKHRHPGAKLVAGNTEIGVETKFKGQHYQVLISLNQVGELCVIEKRNDGVWLGGNTKLTEMEHVLKKAIESLPEYKTRVFSAIVEMLRWFAGHQIRNVACIAGNIATASPISDLNPLLLAAGSKLCLASKEGGEREILMDETFFTGYRTTVIKPAEVIVRVYIPFTTKNEYFLGYKQAHRRDDDIAIVNSGMRVSFTENTNVIENMTLCYGGMAPNTVMATKTANRLTGRRWDESIVSDCCELLAQDLPLPPGTPGGFESYRSTLASTFFFKFYMSVCDQLNKKQIITSDLPPSHLSSTRPYSRDPSHGIQVYEEVPADQPDSDSVGRPMMHKSALKQATGEAVYVNDMPTTKGELQLAFVTSTKAHARLVNVDPSAALSMSGVVGYIDHEDVPGSNITGCIIPDEEVFASQEVHCQGHIIGAIVADTLIQAQRAARKVRVVYEDLPAIITIEEAIAVSSYLQPSRTVSHGDVTSALTGSDHVVEGEVRMGGQEHFYLETQCCVAVPLEDGEMEVFSSTQNPSDTQKLVARALGVPASKVCCRVKRMGGGFGGKQDRSTMVSVPVAIAANRFGRVVRCMLDRDEDMVMTGGRHPFLSKYKVGFTNDGKITALEVDLYSNGGYSLDLTWPVIQRAMFHVDNSYCIPNVQVRGHVCRTNLPSNTAFRGFGGPQGCFLAENYIDHVARTLNIRSEQVRELNLYKDGDVTHYKQALGKCTLDRCWQTVLKQSEMTKRLAEVQQFNRDNRWKKRGISAIPVKYGVAFEETFLNQSGALVNIYTDGSVLLVHGGTEMGQGLHTKMIQVASRALKIPESCFHISETSTSTVPNAPPTAASSGSDLNGMAVMHACETLLERLQPYKKKNPKGKWEDWVTAAYFDRVSLSATGFYRTPDINFDWETMEGPAYNYYTYGAACTEVEIDCLTGDHTVLKTDIVIDLGSSLNPAIDIGQVEGGFVQGYGLFTLEEHRYSPEGFLFTRGPGMYKIPGFTDIPVEMNCSLLKGSTNPRAVYSSKAVGEPPLFLSASCFFAIKNAISAARGEMGLQGHFRLDSPATAVRIRMACQDQFTARFPEPEPGTYKPWHVDV